MIVGVQDTGIFWYYPAYQDPNENPTSIEIQARSDRVHLREEIRHALTPGWLRIISIFSKKPLDVLTIEDIIENERNSKGGIKTIERLPISSTGQLTTLLRVQSRLKDD